MVFYCGGPVFFLVAAGRGYSLAACTGFSSRVGPLGSSQLPGLSSCGVQAQLPHDMWNPSGSEIKPVSSHWQVDTTGSPGKSKTSIFLSAKGICAT